MAKNPKKVTITIEAVSFQSKEDIIRDMEQCLTHSESILGEGKDRYTLKAKIGKTVILPPDPHETKK